MLPGGFDSLSSLDINLAKKGIEAEELLHIPEYCFMALRGFVGYTLQFLERKHSIPPPPAGLKLKGEGEDQHRINRLAEYGVCISQSEVDAFHTIRFFGNKGSHAAGNEQFFTARNAEKAINSARLVGGWLYSQYVQPSKSREESRRFSTPTAGLTVRSVALDDADRLPPKKAFKPMTAALPESYRYEPSTGATDLGKRGLIFLLAALLIFGFGITYLERYGVEQVGAKLPEGARAGFADTKAESLEAVAAAYRSAIPSNVKVSLGKTAVAGGFGIQNWQEENVGGQALLEYDGTKGEWVSLTSGVGAWSVATLVQAGVPRETALVLLAKVPVSPPPPRPDMSYGSSCGLGEISSRAGCEQIPTGPVDFSLDQGDMFTLPAGEVGYLTTISGGIFVRNVLTRRLAYVMPGKRMLIVSTDIMKAETNRTRAEFRAGQ